MKNYLRTLFIFLIFFCLGCEQQEVASNLDAQRSAEMVVALAKEGIPAEREKISSSAKSESYRVLINEASKLKALEVLARQGLLIKEQDRIEELLTPSLFVPVTQELTRRREDYILSKQIEKMLSQFPGISSAKVMIRSQGAASLKDKPDQKRSSATVVIARDEASSSNKLNIEAVKELVMSVLPEISADRVMVKIIEIPSISVKELVPSTKDNKNLLRIRPFSFSIVEAIPGTARKELGGMLLICSLVSFLAGYLIGMVLGGIRTKQRLSSRLQKILKEE